MYKFIKDYFVPLLIPISAKIAYHQTLIVLIKLLQCYHKTVKCVGSMKEYYKNWAISHFSMFKNDEPSEIISVNYKPLTNSQIIV